MNGFISIKELKKIRIIVKSKQTGELMNASLYDIYSLKRLDANLGFNSVALDIDGNTRVELHGA